MSTPQSSSFGAEKTEATAFQNSKHARFAAEYDLLLQKLAQKDENPTDLSIEGDFLSSAIGFLSRQPECFICRYPAIAAETLKVFSIENFSSDAFIGAFLGKVAKCMNECLKCLKMWYESCDAIRSKYEKLYEQETVHQLFRVVDAWSIKRLTNSFLTADSAETNALYSVIEVCLAPYLLAEERDFSELFTTFIQENSTKLTFKEFYPGLVVFSFHAVPAIRKWAIGALSCISEKRSKCLFMRCKNFIAQYLKEMFSNLISAPNQRLFLIDQMSCLKCFCYVLLYCSSSHQSESGTESILCTLVPFEEWFRWFFDTGCALVIQEKSQAKLVFRALIACSWINLDFILATREAQLLEFFVDGFVDSVPADANAFFDSIQKNTEFIFYPTVIRFFNQAIKISKIDFAIKLVNLLFVCMKKFRNHATYLKIVIYYCLKVSPTAQKQFLNDEFVQMTISDLLLPSSTSSNVSASQFFVALSKDPETQNIRLKMLPRLLENSSELSPLTHAILWKHFCLAFVECKSGGNDELFYKFLAYFYSITTSIPVIPFDEFLNDFQFVLSLLLLLCSPFDNFRGVIVKCLIKKYGFIAQNYFYTNCYKLIWKALCKIYKLAPKSFEESDSLHRYSDFFSAFMKSCETNCTIKENFSGLWNLMLSIMEVDDKIYNNFFCQVVDYTIELFGILFSGDSKTLQSNLIVSKDLCSDVDEAKFDFHDPNSYLFLIFKVYSSANTLFKPKLTILFKSIIKCYVKLDMDLPENAISTLKLLVTSDMGFEEEQQNWIRAKCKMSLKSKTEISPIYYEIQDNEPEILERGVISNVAAQKRTASYDVIPNQIKLADLDPVKIKPPKPRPSNVIDLSNLDSLSKRSREESSAANIPRNPVIHRESLREMLSISEEFSKDGHSSLSCAKAGSGGLLIDIAPNPQPNRSVKLIETIPGYEDPLLKRRMKSTHELNTKNRLSCDTSPLFRKILAWDHRNLSKEKIHFLTTKEIPTQFASSQDYENTFEPLLLMETKAQIIRSMEEMDTSEARNATLMSVGSVNDFSEILLSCTFDALKMYSEHDYLLVEKSKEYSFSALISEIIPRNGIYEMRIRSFFSKENRIVLPELREGSSWKLQSVCNLITIIREYQALKGLAYVPVKDFVLAPKMFSVETDLIERKTQQFSSLLKLNKSQAVAVAASVLNTSPFTLIQGPPGTGKTKTILSIVGLILSPDGDATTGENSVVKKRRQILLSAPSNAAVDELVRRIKVQGLLSVNGAKFFPKIVRFGTMDNIHDDIRDVTLDALIERNMGKSIIEKCDNLRGQISQLEASMQNLDENRSREVRHTLQAKRTELRIAIKKVDDSKQSLRSKLLSDSDIICCTLSGSGHELLSKLDPVFDTVIIDEACQCVETSSLIPMKYKCRTCILVGDPNQLPPTVLSSQAQRHFYERSLFQRVQTVIPNSVYLLSVQYRMHPEISVFPSLFFYDGKLENGPNVTELGDFVVENETAVSERGLQSILSPYMFFNVAGKEELSNLKSYKNVAEIHAAISIVKCITKLFSKVNLFGRIGIITPYKQQQKELRRLFLNEFGPAILKAIDINTVDAFQGQEKDIIIFSCVRAGSSVGFLADTRRLNVALTRAKKKIFMLGNATGLVKNMLWGNLITDAKSRQRYIDLPNTMATESARHIIDMDVSFKEIVSEFKSSAVKIEKKEGIAISRPGSIIRK